ncbi:MAG: diacylglycerol kinase family lipid kinase [Acidobacteriota bacterium]|nr:diacylglycerol kinase family lipid kinase [Acidobacteriota bacterium]
MWFHCAALCFMVVMQKAALIYNPVSGQLSSRRAKVIPQALAILREAGVEVVAFETNAPGSATRFAREAVEQGFDAVLACGGDGTMHEVLQALVGTEVALGVVPLGTANVLAQALGLSTSAIKAVRKLVSARNLSVPVGRIHYRNLQGHEQTNYFTVAAGVGADALLMARMDKKLKRRLGYVLYLIEAFRIWATGPFPLFQVRIQTNGDAEPQLVEASQVLAVRVRSFGGALGVLTPGSTLRGEDLRILLFKTRSRWRYFRFLMATLAGRQTFNSEIEILNANSVECLPHNGSSELVYAEADGEWLGSLPARIEIASERLTLLAPADARP